MKTHAIAILLLVNSVCPAQQRQNKHLLLNTDSQLEFMCLHPGEIRPSGWIKFQMQRDLKDGFAGQLDQLTKRAGDSVFIHRRSQDWDGNEWKSDPRFEEYKVMFRWWDGETEGNWRTGLVQMAYLADDTTAMKKSASYLDRVVEQSHADGYIGMFGSDIRYHTVGDLWSQSTILRALLAYYYLTGKAAVLQAVIRAVDQMFDAYNVFSEHFNIYDVNRNGHSLASYTDIAEQLYKITGERKYLLFVDILYKDFTTSTMVEGSKESPRESVDAKLHNLLDMNKPFMEHAVHTVEQIRAPLFLQYYFKDSIKYEWAYENAMKKLAQCVTPSGACVGDEWIQGQRGGPDVGYEYCTMTELL
ncbi:MAG TPA: beta-L-arabinofuranosidase domain-containing protein, partial [Bacteroidota bacterium]|nr:beta-L-arabinofuranosidase domain-containing protein [Bacteroidota bacterium]